MDIIHRLVFYTSLSCLLSTILSIPIPFLLVAFFLFSIIFALGKYFLNFLDEKKFVSQHPEIFRKLHFFEEITRKAHRVGMTTICHVVEALGPFTEDIVREAIFRIKETHPILGARVLEHGTSTYWAKSNFLPILTIQEYSGASEEELELFLEKMYSDEISRTIFDESHELGWKVIWLKRHRNQKNYFFFIFSHSRIDGLSLLVISQQFIEYCSKISSREEIIPYSTPFPPNRRLPFSWIKFFRIFPKKAKILGLSGICMEFPEKFAWNVGIRSTHLVRTTFTKPETSAIMRAAKQHGVSVNSILITAAMVASKKFMQKYYPKSGKIPDLVGYSFVSQVRDINLPPIPKDTVGLYTDLHLSSFHSQSSEDFWNIAKKFFGEQVMELNHRIDLASIFGKLMPGDLMKMLPNTPFGRTGCFFCVSNVGAHQIPPVGEFSMEGLWSGMSGHLMGDYCQHFVGTVNGRMGWNMLYYKPLWSMERAREHLEMLKKILLDSCCQDV